MPRRLHLTADIQDNPVHGLFCGLERLRAVLPRSPREREGRVPVRFRSYGPHGPMPMGRTLSVPSWEEIAGNYAGATGESLVHLMIGDLPWRGGQLILWHGETGTGKTTALRALAREWTSWCEEDGEGLESDSRRRS